MATSAPAGENIQIDIAENGTTTLATAGKYCEANIDVNVNVPEKATQFTNYYNPAYVTIDTFVYYMSSEGYVVKADAECNSIRIPYKHISGDTFELRMRGIGTVRSRFNMLAWKEDGTIVVWDQMFNRTKYYDEYGDVVFVFEADSSFTTRDWDILEFNFQYVGFNSAAEAMTGPIITINEPIGNGGHAG